MMKCRKCKSSKLIKFGTRMTRAGRKQSYQCQKCGYVFIDKRKAK